MEKEQEGFINWDFREADTKQFTHGIHTYPAMMIPQIARRLIYLYGKDAKTLLDPFMGSGTSLVEASLTNQIKEAYGFDLNPLAFLISKVKTTPLNIENLDKELSNIIKSKNYKELPKFKNIEFWFKPKVIEQLAIIKTAINKINDKGIKDFFLVCFSETVRNVSNTRNGEFKLYRMSDKDLIKHNPYVISEFERIALKNMKGMKEYVKARQKTKTIPQNYSSMEELPLSPESIDLIVTSPPYGDSKTTVAYGQFSRLALQWLDYEDVASLDNRLLGGKASKELEIKINSSTLKEIIKRIAEIDGKRAKEVLSFYEDFDKCVIQLDRVMTKNGFVCFVVGNRTVKGINIPTDKIMTEMFKARGNYKYMTTHLRAIPNKRMPSLNSPSNKAGEKVTTMCNEFIFVLQKI
ncbi:DNA methyltransferase [Candidatus Pacearchaeota archaeon]|nr:DNA methyltransferase [Candidatus Pacearchaeota archaeon]